MAEQQQAQHSPSSRDSTTPRVRIYTPAACDFCKSRHHRCDAKEPRCSLCERYNIPCVYDAPRRKKGRKNNGEVIVDDNDVDLRSSSSEQHHNHKQRRTFQGADSDASAATVLKDLSGTYERSGGTAEQRKQFAAAFDRSPFSMLLFFNSDLQHQQQQQSSYSSHHHAPHSGSSNSTRCVQARQFFNQTVIMIGAYNSKEERLASQYASAAEEFLSNEQLLDFPSVHTARGLLLIAYYSYTTGHVYKAKAFCALVQSHCGVLETHFSRSIKCCEPISMDILSAVIKSLKVWANILLLGSEADPEVAHVIFLQTEVLACQRIERAALYLQMLRVDAIALLANRQTSSSPPSRCELLLRAFDLEFVTCAPRPPGDASLCSRHYCCSSPCFNAAVLPLMPLYYALSACFASSRSNPVHYSAQITHCVQILRMGTFPCRIFSCFAWQAALIAVKLALTNAASSGLVTDLLAYASNLHCPATTAIQNARSAQAGINLSMINNIKSRRSFLEEELFDNSTTSRSEVDDEFNLSLPELLTAGSIWQDPMPSW